MQFSSTLSDEYTTERMKEDAFRHAWPFKGEGFYRVAPARAALLINDRQNKITYAKTKYYIRIPQQSGRVKVMWAEVFTPKDPNPDDEIIPEKEYKYFEEEISGVVGDLPFAPSTREYVIDPSTTPDKEGTWEVVLLPVEVAVDANRNGKVEFGIDQTSSATPYRFWVNSDSDTDEDCKLPLN